jgi:hypothetical protein
MDIPPIGPSTDIVSAHPPTANPQDERLTRVVNDALQAAWNISPGKKLKVEGHVRHLFDEATRSLMQDISLQLRERAPQENKLPNLACEELGRIASQMAAEEGLLMHSFFEGIEHLGDSKAQQGLIKLLLVTDLVGELGLQLDEEKIAKIDEAFEWAISASAGEKGISSDSQVLHDAIQLGEVSLVDLLTAGYPLNVKN